MMLYFARRMPTILDYQARRAWFKNRIDEFTSNVLRGKTVGIIGYGALGREVGRLSKAFGMRVIASLGRRGKTLRDSYRTPGTGDADGAYPDEWFAPAELADVLPRMDFIVLGLRLTPETTGVINREALSRVKPTAILLNPSRGALIDEAALVDALKSRRLAGAALDVFCDEPLPPDSPLRDAPNLVISPHCSAETQFFRDEIVELIIANLLRFAEGLPLLNVLIR
jgi:phosphoglycerate dehydrogenase-like enzyme